MEKISITNEQLGAVYLKIEGLDKERFRKLTEGMKFYSTVEQELNDGYSYIEYYNGAGGFQWLSVGSADEDAQLITLDELEERLFPFTLPEKWCIKITEDNKKVLANWRTDGDSSGKFVAGKFKGWYLHTPMNGKNGYNKPNKEEGYAEITFEQFKKHVLKQDCDMKTTTTFKVTRQALAEVLPHVCSDYRDKIKNIAQIDLFSNEIEVPEDTVRQAHKDATNTVQIDWLNKYLPLPKKKKIEVVEVKEDGFWSRATLENSTAFNDLKIWKNIILIKENFKDGLDLIMCYGSHSNEYACNHFLGHFNEGNLEY